MRALETYQKECRFFYIARHFARAKEAWGWARFCSWALRRPCYAVAVMRLLVAQRSLIARLDYDLHNCRYARDYFMRLSLSAKNTEKESE